MEILIQFVLLVGGFSLLAKGADWFVDGAAGIAEKFGIPQLVIGLTIVAMGTSAPEAAVSITAALRGSAAITIGNVVGSNILNVLIILGLTAVITSVSVAKSTVTYEIPYMIFITLLLIAFGYTGGQITLIEGVLLWVCFLIYLAYLFKMAKENKEEAEDQAQEKSIARLFALTVIGLVGIILGSDVTVDAATAIAKAVGLSQRFIGLTIVALGTSLPELFTSVSAAIKGKADIAIGNIVGSNVFNVLFVVGTTALITPVVFMPKFVIDTLIAAGAGVLLWACVWKKQKLQRSHGVIMLICYGAYFAYLLL
ncbi:MAG: calcium/sodium antiporter [Anaerostipes sp.]|uniref:calcium/sodium antiporter n=1 Tax=Anaerostipes sp. 992a TaxID=1261637 RepID=UPI000952D90C|nr:calcium/sodium antiporter [Anaerostipes sp. 992a]MCI5951292.1 calcium/sodium antiporter [Anaerostipes sp.]MDD5967993.1 calcium/sodium antiporter [Anaerostipes sp.]OLR61002.1 sodium:proton exchanger [Anaerostipes sp. 992a]